LSRFKTRWIKKTNSTQIVRQRKVNRASIGFEQEFRGESFQNGSLAVFTQLAHYIEFMFERNRIKFLRGQARKQRYAAIT